MPQSDEERRECVNWNSFAEPSDESTILPDADTRYEAPARPYEDYPAQGIAMSQPGAPIQQAAPNPGRGRMPLLITIGVLTAVICLGISAWAASSGLFSPDEQTGAAAGTAQAGRQSTETVTVMETPVPADAVGANPTETEGTLHPDPEGSSAATIAGPDGVREPPTNPACDGRGIIIYGSAYGPNVGQQINDLLAAHPGAVYASPGACASLNPEADGYPVYAIYKDFGHDREALCAADTGTETNSRIMQDKQIYGDYCRT